MKILWKFEFVFILIQIMNFYFYFIGKDFLFSYRKLFFFYNLYIILGLCYSQIIANYLLLVFLLKSFRENLFSVDPLCELFFFVLYTNKENVEMRFFLIFFFKFIFHGKHIWSELPKYNVPHTSYKCTRLMCFYLAITICLMFHFSSIYIQLQID